MIRWFTPQQMLTYNCTFNFVIGDRGGGKSFGTLEFCINRFKKTGEQFIYLRRTERELDDAKPSLFDALKKEGKFPEDELKAKGDALYVNNETMGYSIALSTSMKRKSIPYPNVKWIIFEEFMVDGITSRYLGHGEQECELFENLYETVDRLRDETRVIFISNAFSKVNIYFTHYGVNLPENMKTYNRFNKHIMVCLWQDEGYREKKKQTTFYKLTEGTDFNKHAYENEFYQDKTHFVRKRDPETELNFGLSYQGKNYRVWVNWNDGKYYVTAGGNVPPRKMVSLSLADNRPNNTNIRRVKNMPFMKFFRRAVDENNVYYDNLKTYQMLNEVVYLLQTTR